ncbi:deleted in malignant brain tumors 1 protein-like, partial [Clarias magur]
IEQCLFCSCDAVKVYDGPSTSSPLLGTVCGSDSQAYISSRNTLTMIFSSDSAVVSKGFIANWNFT